MKPKKIFSNTIFGLDIETTTINVTSEKKCSFMYSFCVGCLDIESELYTNLHLGRTYKDLDTFLFDLDKTAKEMDLDFIIYIHNFAYEMSFFINNSNFFKHYINDENSNYLFTEKNKPLYFKGGNLEFRCSYLLLDKSIATIGESIQLPKLDYDYNKLRTPLTDLNKKEIEYNFRDVEIMLKGVYALIKSNKFIECSNDLPYTKTGVMRFNCEKNPQVNISKKYVNKWGKEKKGSSLKLNKYLCGLEKAKDITQLEFWEKLFQGGLVFSNPKYIGDILTNLASYDFSSDYPFQMLVRYFPSEFEEFKGDKIRKINQCMYKSTYRNYVRTRPLNTMFNAIIIVSDIKQKFEFQPIGTSKIESINENIINMKNSKIINGKILELKPPVKMYVTCIDYLTLNLFYDFKLIDVEYLEIAKRYKRSNEFKLNSVEYNAKAKIEFKTYNELVEHKNEYHKYTPDEIQNDDFRNAVNAENDYFSQLEISNTMYMNVKSDLNALYGDNAQHLIHELITYDTNKREWIVEKETFEDYKKAQHKTSYIYGVYVPQYARASILYIAYKFLTNGLPVYYIDTDSIKTINCKLADELVNEYNELQLAILDNYAYLKFGILEKEYIADKFATLGTKSYIKLEKKNNKLICKATISGLPKATKLFNELLNYFDGNFDEMIFNVYHYGTIFDETITNKLTSLYSYDTYDIDVEGYHDTVVSGVVLTPCAVTMRDFTSRTWEIYARLICRLYDKNYKQFTRKTLIFRNENNEIDIKEVI